MLVCVKVGVMSAKPGGTAGEYSLLSLQKSGDRSLFRYKPGLRMTLAIVVERSAEQSVYNINKYIFIKMEARI